MVLVTVARSSQVGKGPAVGTSDSGAGLQQARATIKLAALRHNYRQVLGLLSGSDTTVIAMVKANAYGHGAARVTRALVDEGCTTFGVATLDEARELIEESACAAEQIIVFGGVLPGSAAVAVALGVQVAAHSEATVQALAREATAVGREVAVHIKVDTGMHRLGVEPEQAGRFARLLADTEGTRPVALCSHFAQAESVTGSVTEGQLEGLLLADRLVRDEGLELTRHLANSAGVMTRPEAWLDRVRPGIMLYGLYPDSSLLGKVALKPVMTFEAPVLRVTELGSGQGIGYGHSFHTTRPSRVATLRCGYADGYPRALGNRGRVLLGGGLAPVVGRVCMDHTVVDVTDLGEVREGDSAVMWGDSPSTEDVAVAAETISYELVARVGARVERRYKDD